MDNEKLDIEIKKILQENDDIVVPDKIINGIDETLNNLHKKKAKPRIKIAMVASIVMLAMIGPSAVGAARDVLYTYIPSLGNTISADSTIYSLEKSITKSVGSRIVTVIDIYYNQESKKLSVDVEGNGQLPEEIAKIKINNRTIKSYESSVSKGSYNRPNTSWSGSYYFKYHKPYKENEIVFSMILDNGEKIEFSCKLQKAKGVKDISELGPTTTNKGITITAVVNEENNKLSVNLLQNLDNIYLKYGDPYLSKYELENYGEDAVYLIDAYNKEIKGDYYEESIYSGEEKFIFDTTEMEKPFKIVIPQVIASVGSLERDIISEEIELPIPKDYEKVYVNKDVTLDVKNKLFENSNNKVKIVSIQKVNDEKASVELQFDNTNKDKIQLEMCTIVPVGESTSEKAKDWFEGGLNGGAIGEDGIEWNFKLPYSDAEKLYVKILGGEYIIRGPWEIHID